MDVIRPGNVGEPVRDVQHRLLALGHRIDAAELDGSFGPTTHAAVRAFQERRGLPADGLVGTATWGELVEASWRLGDRTLYLRSPSFRGDDVRELQRRLNALGFDAGKEDGIFGERTGAAVVEFQRNLADVADGVVGLDTVRALDRLRPTLEGPSRAVVREEETVRHMAGSLHGSTIAIDPGGGPPSGQSSTEGRPAVDRTAALANALAEELGRRGAQPVIVRTGTEDPPASLRAERANHAGASVCVSIHLAADGGSTGATCYFYGTPTTHSPAGRRLAELVLAELVSLGLGDAGIHPRALPVLRETRMPAVQIELSAPDPEGGGVPDDSVARAVVAALDRFFSVGETQPTTSST